MERLPHLSLGIWADLFLNLNLRLKSLGKNLRPFARQKTYRVPALNHSRSSLVGYEMIYSQLGASSLVA